MHYLIPLCIKKAIKVSIPIMRSNEKSELPLLYRGKETGSKNDGWWWNSNCTWNRVRGRKWSNSWRRHMCRCWSCHHTRSYTRVGKRAWRKANREKDHTCQASSTRRCSKNEDHRRPRTRSGTPGSCGWCSRASPSAPPDTRRWGRRDIPWRCTRPWCRPSPRSASEGCNRRPGSRRRSPTRRRRLGWTLPMSPEAWHRRRTLPFRNRSPRWRKRTSRPGLDRRGSVPISDPTKISGFLMSSILRSGERIRWWEAAARWRRRVIPAISCGDTCSQSWTMLIEPLQVSATT